MTEIALIDSGVNRNCILEGLIPLKYYEKSSKRLNQANEKKLLITYKLTNAHVYNDGIWFNIILGLNKVIILKDINKERIHREHLTLKSLDEHLTENDKKKVRQNRETEICSYSPIILLQRHQPPCTKELSRK